MEYNEMDEKGGQEKNFHERVDYSFIRKLKEK